MAIFYDSATGNYYDDGTGNGGGGGMFGDPFGMAGGGGAGGLDWGIGAPVLSGLGGVALGAGGALLIEELLKDKRRGNRGNGQGITHSIPGGNILFNDQQGGGVAVAGLPRGFRVVSEARGFQTNAQEQFPAGNPTLPVYRCLDANGGQVTYNPSTQFYAMVTPQGMGAKYVPPQGWTPGWP